MAHIQTDIESYCRDECSNIRQLILGREGELHDHSFQCAKERCVFSHNHRTVANKCHKVNKGSPAEYPHSSDYQLSRYLHGPPIHFG